MASRKTLLEISYHNDDDTGMYKVGEIDDIKKEVNIMQLTVTDLNMFKAVQTEKNQNHDQKYSEVIDWLKSINSKLDDLIKGKN